MKFKVGDIIVGSLPISNQYIPIIVKKVLTSGYVLDFNWNTYGASNSSNFVHNHFTLVTSIFQEEFESTDTEACQKNNAKPATSSD